MHKLLFLSPFDFQKSFPNKESGGIYLEGKRGAQAVYFCVHQNVPKDRMCLCLLVVSGRRGKEVSKPGFGI